MSQACALGKTKVVIHFDFIINISIDMELFVVRRFATMLQVKPQSFALHRSQVAYPFVSEARVYIETVCACISMSLRLMMTLKTWL